MAVVKVSSCVLVIGLVITACEPACGLGWNDSCPTPGSYCSLGWQRWGNSCYRLTTNQKNNFSGAVEDCKNLGGEMAAPRSAEENDLFVNLTGNFRDLWIACSQDRDKKQWLCNGQSQKFSNWKTGEPDNDNNQHCVSLCGPQSDYNEGDWLDVTCYATSNKFPAVCIIRPIGQPKYCFPTDKSGQLVQQSLDSHTIRELTTPTVVGCGRACVDEPMCRSYNIKRRDGQKSLCQLNNATRCEAPEYFRENTTYFSFYSDDIWVEKSPISTTDSTPVVN